MNRASLFLQNQCSTLFRTCEVWHTLSGGCRFPGPCFTCLSVVSHCPAELPAKWVTQRSRLTQQDCGDLDGSGVFVSFAAAESDQESCSRVVCLQLNVDSAVRFVRSQAIEGNVYTDLIAETCLCLPGLLWAGPGRGCVLLWCRNGWPTTCACSSPERTCSGKHMQKEKGLVVSAECGYRNDRVPAPQRFLREFGADAGGGGRGDRGPAGGPERHRCKPVCQRRGPGLSGDAAYATLFALAGGEESHLHGRRLCPECKLTSWLMQTPSLCLSRRNNI